MLASCFAAAGYRAGVYTSPHLLALEERIALAMPGGAGGRRPRPIPADDLAFLLRRHADAIRARVAAEGPGGPGALSHFELTTAMALRCAWLGARGLGGRGRVYGVCKGRAGRREAGGQVREDGARGAVRSRQGARGKARHGVGRPGRTGIRGGAGNAARPPCAPLVSLGVHATRPTTCPLCRSDAPRRCCCPLLRPLLQVLCGLPCGRGGGGDGAGRRHGRHQRLPAAQPAGRSDHRAG